MKAVVSFFAVLLFACSAVSAAESHYEVYYFHASWRCTNCTNAEAWAGEAVDMVRNANPDIPVVFAPKQLEKNQALVKRANAKRVDLVVVEVADGKIIRMENLGNLLNVVGSKPLLIKTALDGIFAFDAKGKDGARLKRPEAMTALSQNGGLPPAQSGTR